MTEPNLDEQIDDLFQVFTYEDVDTGSVGIQFVSKTNRIWISEREWIDKKATIKALIANQVREAKIEEVERIPNPAYINPTTGLRVEPNQQYKADRIATLNGVKNK